MKRLRIKIPVLIVGLVISFAPLQSQVWNQIGSDFYGLGEYSTSLSADGSVVAIGSSGYSMGAGSVHILKNQGGTWSQIGNTIDGEAKGDEFGWSVSLSADGSVVAIGAPFNYGNGPEAGHVRIYENQSGTWSQIGGDIEGDTAMNRFGFSVNLSADGSVVAIGAPFYNANGPLSGHVRIFENQGGNWVQIGDAIEGEAAEDRFGWSVSLSADGSTVAIGAPRNDGNGINAGHVRIFENHHDSTWSQVGGTIEGEGLGGSSLSLSADGFVIAVGGPAGNTGNGYSTGHVRVFEYQGGIWSQIGSAIKGETAGDYFGASVSLSTDGSVVAIGAPWNAGNGYDAGHVSVFENQSSSWSKIGNTIEGDTIHVQFGWSTSLSADGSVVVIGSSGSGYVRIYENSTVSSKPLQQQSFSFYPNPTTNSFQVKGLATESDGMKIKVYDMTGEMVFARQYADDSPTVNIGSLTPGIYFVKLIIQGQTAVRKVVKL
ncbi:MAG: T9SS type A sorting domain-containing protein [Bacteroidales bacterium]